MRFVQFCIFISCVRSAFSKAISIQIETDDISQLLANMKAGIFRSQDVNSNHLNGKILDQFYQILTSNDQPHFNPYHPEDHGKYKRAKTAKLRKLISKQSDDDVLEKDNEKYDANNGLNKISEHELTEENHEERRRATAELIKNERKQRIKATKSRPIDKVISDDELDKANDGFLSNGLNKISEDELTENRHEKSTRIPVNKGNKSDKRANIEKKYALTKLRASNEFLLNPDESSNTEIRENQKKTITKTANKNRKKGRRFNIKSRPQDPFESEPTVLIDTILEKHKKELQKQKIELASTSVKKNGTMDELSQSEADALEDLYMITQDNVGKNRFKDMKSTGLIYN